MPFATEHVADGHILEPYAGSVAEDGKSYPYHKRPLWVLLVAAADLVGGTMGMRVMLLLAASAGVAATAWLTTAVQQDRLGWLGAAFALLSPLALNGLQLWSHAATIPLLAVVYVGAVRSLTRPSRLRWLIGMFLAAGGAVALHQSALPFALAAACVLMAHGALARRAGAVAAAIAVGLGATVGHVGSAAWSATIVVRSTDVGNAIRPGVTAQGRLRGLLDVFATNVSYNGSPSAKFLGCAAVVLALAAAVLWRRHRMRAGTVAIGFAIACWVVRMAIDADAVATGLFVAWPVVVFIAMRPVKRWTQAEKMLAQIVGVAFVMVALTLSEVGGGLNWGGRYVSGAVPILAVLAAGSLDRDRSDESHDAWLVRGCALALAGVVTIAGLRADGTIRVRHDGVSDLAAQASTKVVLTSNPLLPRRSWKTVDDVDWLVVAPDADGGIMRTESILRAAGIRSFTAYQLDAVHYRYWTGMDPSTQPRGGVVIELAP